MKLGTVLRVSGFAAVSVAVAIRRQVQDLAPEGPVSYTQDIYSWKSQDIDEDEEEEGEAHRPIEPPAGAEFTNIPVAYGDVEAEMPVFRTKTSPSTEHVYIIVHGKLRDGDYYWKTMHSAVESARTNGLLEEDKDVAIVAPQFFSTKYNSGQYGDQSLAWADLNAWQTGSRATHPEGTKATSFDAIDAIIADYADTEKYPDMKNFTVVGHGGGGQMVQRYATVGRESPSHVHVRYIHGDPSSSVYFTKNRPENKSEDVPSKDSCEEYNTWRYGFDHFLGTSEGKKPAKEYFQQYMSRDIISIVGYKDVKSAGDETCMAKMQGGDKRRDRNLIWYRYVNELARTGEDLRGFPGKFHDLPDWGDVVNGTSKVRLVIVRDAEHDVAELFTDDKAQSALFSNGDVAMGWEPGEGFEDIEGADEKNGNKKDKHD